LDAIALLSSVGAIGEQPTTTHWRRERPAPRW
jgi:hypothetical protein